MIDKDTKWKCYACGSALIHDLTGNPVKAMYCRDCYHFIKRSPIERAIDDAADVLKDGESIDGAEKRNKKVSN